MKILKFTTLAIFTMLVSVIQSSCSNDEPSTSTIIGKWICIETNSGSNYYYDYGGFDLGDVFLFFNGEFESDDKLKKGKKCFILYPHYSNYNSALTETDWDNYIHYDWDSDWQSHREVYSLNGSSLSIIESDLDRWIGSISIDGDIMTFTYKYQNWNYDLRDITYESKTYVSKFQKQ